MAMAGMRTKFAADSDRKILRDLYFYAKDEVTLEPCRPLNIGKFAEHVESFLGRARACYGSRFRLINNNGSFSGLVGIVGDPLLRQYLSAGHDP